MILSLSLSSHCFDMLMITTLNYLWNVFISCISGWCCLQWYFLENKLTATKMQANHLLAQQPAYTELLRAAFSCLNSSQNGSGIFCHYNVFLALHAKLETGCYTTENICICLFIRYMWYRLISSIKIHKRRLQLYNHPCRWWSICNQALNLEFLHHRWEGWNCVVSLHKLFIVIYRIGCGIWLILIVGKWYGN